MTSPQPPSDHVFYRAQRSTSKRAVASLGKISGPLNYIPRISSEFDELISLARDEIDLANAVRDFLEAGLPIVRADIDNCSTSPTGNRVFTYQLPEHLKVLAAAARARKFDPVDVPARE